MSVTIDDVREQFTKSLQDQPNKKSEKKWVEEDEYYDPLFQKF